LYDEKPWGKIFSKNRDKIAKTFKRRWWLAAAEGWQRRGGTGGGDVKKVVPGAESDKNFSLG